MTRIVPVPCEATDQAAGLRRLARRPAAPAGARAPLTIAVTSGKGGVGKTNLAVNLALTLQFRGVHVTLVDLDVGLANGDVLLDVQPRFGLRDVILGRRELADSLTPTPTGLMLLAGMSGPEGLGRLNEIERAKLAVRLRTISGDVVVLDCAAGIGESVTTFARTADIVLVMTTPEPTALADAYATVKTLLREGYDGSVRLVVNMVESRLEAKGVYERIRGVCEKFINFPIADAGYLLHDTYVELAVRQRAPFVLRYPRCSASVCVAAIAARLVHARAKRAERGSVLARVVGMFT